MKSNILFCIISLFIPLAANAGGVTPEQFGAKGDGIADDTYSIIKAFETRQPVELRNTYKVSKSLTLNSSISGGGRILFAEEQISLHIKGKGINVSSITFDYANHSGKMIRLQNATNIRFNNCMFENVGNDNSTSDVAFVFIMNNSNNIRFDECDFLHCKAKSSKYASSGIWINQESEETKSHYIYIDNCRFEDISPLSDADAIKVVGGNYDCYLFVKSCLFERCAKRAMKFQGRQCFSHNNTIYVTEPMGFAIDFQRGYGKSTNDKIILDYQNNTPIDPTSGLLYRVVNIAQGHVVVSNLSVDGKSPIKNTHQVVFGFSSFSGYDDGVVGEVKLSKIRVTGMGSLLSCSSAVKEIYKLQIAKTSFYSNVKCDIIDFKNARLNMSNVKLDVLGTHYYDIISASCVPNLYNNVFSIGVSTEKKLELSNSNKVRLKKI